VGCCVLRPRCASLNFFYLGGVKSVGRTNCFVKDLVEVPSKHHEPESVLRNVLYFNTSGKFSLTPVCVCVGGGAYFANILYF
jgi:hypothetical protein